YLLVTLLFLCLAVAASTDRSRDYAGAAATGILGSLTHPTFLFAGLGAALGAQLVMPDGTFGWRWPSRRAWRWLWGPWAAVLVAARTDVYADYGIAMLPLVFVASGALVALGAEQMVRGGGWFAAAAATVIAAGVLPSTVSHLSDGTRFDYRPALRAVAATAPTVPVLTWPIVIGRYYAPGLDNRELDLHPEALDAALGAAGDLWVLL